MSKINIGGYTVGMIQTNFYYLYREGSSEAIAVDPGAVGGKLVELLKAKGLTIKAIFLTHAHFDHISGLQEMRDLTGAPVYASIKEKNMCEDPELNQTASWGRPLTVDVDRYLYDGEEITEAGITLKVLSTPGHTEGSCCYYVQEAGILLSGDTLFQQSVGRSDMPTGSQEDLIRSVREKLYVLPDETMVYPGHGGITQIGYEKKHNMFVHG